MPASHQSLVRRRLLLINAVVVITSVVGILSILEVARGVGFHESNIQHLGLTSKLQQKIMKLEGRSAADINEIRGLLTEIRKEPDSCLAARNPALDIGTKILGTNGLFEICQYDTHIIGKALAMIPLYQAGEVSEEEFHTRFSEYSNIMHQHSFEFRPLISRTVEVLLVIAGLLLILKGFAVTLISIYSSRSIMRQFQNVVAIESELRDKNNELEDSIKVLQLQKIAIANAQKLAEFNAMHDTLTGLPNRRYLDAKLAEK